MSPLDGGTDCRNAVPSKLMKRGDLREQLPVSLGKSVAAAYYADSISGTDLTLSGAARNNRFNAPGRSLS